MHPDTGRQLEHVQQKAVEDLGRIADAVAASTQWGQSRSLPGKQQSHTPACRAPHSTAI